MNLIATWWLRLDTWRLEQVSRYLNWRIDRTRVRIINQHNKIEWRRADGR